MNNLNRRSWLRTAGLAGTAIATGGLTGLATDRKTPAALNTADDIVRLMSNENPYGPPQSVRDAMTEAMQYGYQYPRSHYDVLLDKIAAKEGVSKDHILLVSGSNEGLRVAGLTYCQPGRDVVTCTPTYGALLQYVEQFNVNIVEVGLDDHLAFDLSAIQDAVTDQTDMVFYVNPNNPTGALVDGQESVDFCNRMSERTLVFSDEAYGDYIEEANYPTMVLLVKAGKNVIVSRTFSKVYGMAGIRVGYLVARPDMIEQMKPKVMSYVHVMAVYGAAAAMEDTDFRQYALQKNREAKQHIYDVADELGMRYIPSHTNFVFIQTGVDVTEVGERMKKHNIWVGRPFDPLQDWCRISTGTDQAMERWGAAMRAEFG
jgi:histidinol-phosphate aminotransferase